MHPVGIAGLESAARTPKGQISYRQFFFNERGPAKSFAVHYAYAPVEKHEVAFGEDPERKSNAMVSTVVLIDSGRYRAYGSWRSPDERLQGMRIWESEDCLNWEPLRLGQVEDTNIIFLENLPGDQSAIGGPKVVRLGDGRWRMYAWKHREGHLRYIVAESDDGLRWRVTDINKPALYHPHDGGLWKMAEGLAREEMVEMKVSPEEAMTRKRLWSNDASDVIYNDHLDRFECYSVWLHPAIEDRRVDVDNAPGVHRLIQRRLSADGLNFSDPQLVLMPDERDPWDLQFYFLNPLYYEDFIIGRLGHYRVEDGQQSMDTELCFSLDGVTWHRPLRGGWIPRSKPGSGLCDTVGIYAGGPWIDKGDKWLTLYAGTPNPHNSRTYNARTMAASFPRNRFIGVAADRVTGGFMSEPFFPQKGEITLDADIRGWLKAELCDGFGRKLPGFHLQNSAVVTGDSPNHLLRWDSGSVADHLHECLRLRFEMQDAVVYNFAF